MLDYSAVFVQQLLPAGYALRVWPAGPKITFAFSVSVSLCIPSYHVYSNYITYMLPCNLNGNLEGCFV